MLTRKWLMGCLKAQGYNGPETEAEVSKFIGDAKITDEDNNTVDWKAAWSNNVLTFDVPKAPNADERLAKRRAEATTDTVTKANKVDAAEDAVETKTRLQSPDAYHRMMDKKRYDVRAAAGKTVWRDADEAEVLGASLRFMSATAAGVENYGQKARDQEIIAKNSTTFTNASAGFLVDPQYVAQIMYATEMYGAARKLANIVTLTSDQAFVKRKTAIPTMAFVTETGTVAETDATYDMVELVAKKAGTICRYSNELLDDAAVNIADEVSKSVGEAQAKLEDQIYFLGDGTSTYGGMTGFANVSWVTWTAQGTGTTWNAYVVADITDAFGKIENIENARVKITCSRQAYVSILYRLAAVAGGVTALESLGGARGNVLTSGFSYFGVTVIPNQVMPTATASAAKSVLVGDFEAASTIGDRKQLTITRSDEAYFTSDQVAFRALSRVAVNVHGDGRVPASTYGPVTGIKNG